MKGLGTILILLVSMQCYGQSYWLDDFLEDKEASHKNVKIAEGYLDSALHEIVSTRSDLQRLVSQIARDYYRLNLISKGDACRKLIDNSNIIYFENQRMKGLASSQSLEYLKTEAPKTLAIGRIYIAEAFIRKGRVSEAISLVLTNAKEDWEKEDLVQIVCEHLPDIRDITKYYPTIGFNYPKPLYQELNKRIANKSVNPETAVGILNSLKLATDTSYDLISFACATIGDYAAALSYSERIQDEVARLQCIQELATRANKAPDCKIVLDKLVKYTDRRSRYLSWSLQFKSQGNFVINKDVIAKLLINQDFTADDEVMFFLVTRGLIDEALAITDSIKGFNKVNQYREIIKGYIEHDKVKEATALISRLVKTEKCNDCVLSGIETFLKKGDEKNAVLWRQKYFTDSFYEELSVDYFVLYLLMKNDLKRVDDSIKSVKRGADRVFLFREIARYYMGIKWRHTE